MLGYISVIIFSYLLGSSNMALYISKMKRVNLRQGGSGNLGASNAAILMGWRAGIVVALHDILKTVLAVFLAKLLFPELACIGAVAGVMSVLGHIFPFYLKFKGGKGFAPYIGMILAMNWKLALVIGIAIVVVTIITDYIVAGTTVTIISFPCWMGIETHSWLMLGIICIASAVILFKHRENYVRICRGTEVGLRSTARGEHRVK